MARAAPGSSAVTPCRLGSKTGRPSTPGWVSRDDLRDRLASVAAPVTLLHVERGPGDLHAAGAYARAAGLRLDRAALWRGARRASRGVRQGVARPRAAFAHPVLAIHRGAGAAAKRWSADAFAAVATRWRAAGGGVVELLGPAEAGDAAADDATVARDWPLPDVAALLAHVDAYVGNDSGVSHLAAAVGARTRRRVHRDLLATLATARATCARGPERGERRRIPSLRGARAGGACAGVGILDKHLTPGLASAPSTGSARLREPVPAASPASAEDVRFVSPADADERSRVPWNPRDGGR